MAILGSIAITSLLSFIFGMAISLANNIRLYETQRIPHELSWRPDIDWSLEWTRFKGGLLESSPYRGPPSQAVDDAWARFTESPWFSGGAVLLAATEDDIRRSRKASDDEWFNSTVVLDETNGGSYMATLEMFHQLHCLDEVRRATYPEHYQRTAKNWRAHVDHCIEILRQVLMCNADTGLVLFHWVIGKAAATPDFSTWHQCRDPEEVLQWARKNEAPITHTIRKPPDAIEMPSLN
ncbi:hypothetical protein GQ53DRAFT_825741 [Thozetella sp. PMI_491]|nr:hypothetical protein GQ53DRAFT_825741 [Thozetella sp. PMI_491]